MDEGKGGERVKVMWGDRELNENCMETVSEQLFRMEKVASAKVCRGNGMR